MIKLKKKRGGRKSSAVKRIGGVKAIIMLWSRRAGIWGGGAIFALWIGAWIWLSNTPQKAADWMGEEILTISAGAGLNVQEILVEGRHYTDSDILRGIINAQNGDPLMAFNPREAQAMIEKISWVKTVQVERRLPGTIYVGLQEREPLVFWQRNKKLVVIDDEGEILTHHNLDRFKDLIIVTGDDAPQTAPHLMMSLQAEPGIFTRVEAASRVSQRRWNLKLKNGIDVKLPEDDMGFALRRLARSQAEDNLLEKNITQIDMRDPERIVIRTKPGQVRTYQASGKMSDPI